MKDWFNVSVLAVVMVCSVFDFVLLLKSCSAVWLSNVAELLM